MSRGRHIEEVLLKSGFQGNYMSEFKNGDPIGEPEIEVTDEMIKAGIEKWHDSKFAVATIYMAMRVLEPKAKEEYTVGQLVQGRGIYAGTCQYKGKSHHVFTATEDLQENGKRAALTYLEAEKYVKAMGDGWMIPTKDMLKNNLYENRKIIGRFQTDENDLSVWYWSGTVHRGYKSLVWVLRFSDGEGGGSSNKDGSRLSCRPVRIEPVLQGDK